jgi:DNA-binding NtrC family response regulator
MFKMQNRVLFVDDDLNILDGYKRQLRKQFDIETAEGGEKGLDAVKNKGPFAVIVSDLRMPGMDGNQFLAHVKEVAPDSTRILLTGYADLKSAIEAINNGSIFRLLTKPCDRADLIQTLENGIDQYKKNVRSKAGSAALDKLVKKKILIVDRDPFTVRLLKRSLNGLEDLEIFTAEDGKKAIKVLNSENIDLLISDIFIPQINGLQLLNYVDKHFQGLRVIVLTGEATEKLEDEIRSFGNYQFYEKPLDMNVFKDSVLMELRSTSASQIHGINISSFLQLIDIEGKVCTLTVRSHGNVGYLYFRDGELIAAEANGQKGEAAALNIISWNNSIIEISDKCQRNKREIERPLMQILMESARLKDEGSMAAGV